MSKVKAQVTRLATLALDQKHFIDIRHTIRLARTNADYQLRRALDHAGIYEPSALSFEHALEFLPHGKCVANIGSYQ